MFLLAAGLVMFAMRTDADACPDGSLSAADTNYRIIRYAGTQLNRFMPGDGLVKNTCTADSEYTLKLLDASNNDETGFPDAPSAGPHFRLAPDVEFAFSDQNVRITLRARASNGQSISPFEMNYSTGPEGNSGWRLFSLTQEFRDHSFDYQIPEAAQDRGVDFLGIRPVITGGTGMEIESLTFEVLPRQTAVQTQAPNEPKAVPE